MAVFRVERNTGYTVMSNHHLRNKELSLKAKGLLSQMLSLPEDWDYTLAGLSYINREKIDAIREAVRELERAGYIQRSRERDEKGRLRGTDYIIYEQPPNLDLPTLENPTLENPTQEKPTLENPMQLNKDIQKTDLPKKEKSNTDLSSNHSIPILSPNPSPLRKRQSRNGKERKRQTHTVCMRKSSRTISSMSILSSIPTLTGNAWTRLCPLSLKRSAPNERQSVSPGTIIRQSLSKQSL